MSCRVLGRHLESWVLLKISEYAIKNDLNEIIVEYVATDRNKMAEDFLIKSGFIKYEPSKKFLDQIPIQKAEVNRTFYRAISNQVNTPFIEAYRNDRK